MRRKLTIRYKIICLSCIMVLISTMIPAIWFFYEYYNSQTENAYHNITSSTEQLIVTLSKTFGSINNSALSMLSSDPIRDWLAGTLEFKEGTSDYYQLVSEIQNNAKFNVMFSESWLSNSITTGYLVIDGCCIEMLPQLSEHSIRPAQLKSILSRFSHIKNKTSVFLPPQTTKDEVAFIKQLTNANGSKQAYLILSIAQAPFQSILSNTIDQTTASISDQENIVYFSSNSNLVSEFKEPISSGNTLKAFKSNQENQFGIIRQIPQTEFLLNLTIPKNYYTNPIISTLKTYILFMIALLLFVITTTVIMLSVHTNFIRDLSKNVNSIRQKDYTTRMEEYDERDLSDISTTFNKMVQEISDLINKVYTSNLLLKQAEIERLQSQMNPHFLTNTLATISTSALLNNDQEVHEMITCLNDLVTANLYNSKAGNHFVPIQEELDYVRKYLTIQQFRFQDKLRYHIDIENEALLDCFLPRLSIEPIVENAVIHGIQSKNTDDPGCINICLFDEGDDLLFIVADNGKGFEVKKLLQTDNNPSHGHNIGILNTHHRIQLLFGEPYGLEFESTLGVGTLVTMRIPRITKANLSSYVQTTQED